MILGLGYQARVGKNSVADVLVKEHGFRQLAFADRLKQMALEVNPQIGHTHLAHLVDSVGWEVAKNDFGEVRRFLQSFGVALRGVDPDFWVRPIIDELVYADVGHHFVVTDVRFNNECDVLTDYLDGFIVNVTRPGYSGDSDPHVSEQELKGYPFDHVLSNDGSLDDLPAKVGAMLDALRQE